MRRNAEKLRAKLGEGVKLCAVVKADAYGHGAPAVARALEPVADVFAVALVEEGAELRICGIERPVLVLLPAERGELPRALFYGLTLTAVSPGALKEIERAARAAGTVASVHLAADTGMNRIGERRRDRFEAMCAYAERSPFLALTGVFSHFAGADAAFTRLQFERFCRRVALARRYAPDLTAHIAASSHLAERAYQADMVRAGIALYGYGGEGLEIAMTLRAKVLCRKRIRPGDRLLYAEAPETRGRDIALVRLGYADGFPRSGLPNAERPLAMDTSAVTDEAGREIDILGPGRTAEDIACSSGTVSYEILTKALMRADRIYTE